MKINKRYLYLVLLLLVIAAMNLYGQHKNIVIITADDLGVNDLGCYGNSFIETPYLDKLVKDNTFVKLNRAYAATPICSPTRASIITGRTPARIGLTEHLRGTPPVTTNQQMIPPINATGLPANLPTVAQLLKANAYKTAIIGKWHLGGANSAPNLFGYETYYASGSPGLPVSFFYPFFNVGTFPELQADSKSGDYLDDVLANKAVQFIEQNKDKPFFLHINFYAPHVPIQAKQALVDKYTAKRKLSPSDTLPNVVYAAMVENLDTNIETVIEALKKIGNLNDMLIFITSDNGGLDVREVTQYEQNTPPTDNGLLRSGKGNLYEGGIRIPFLINQAKVQPDILVSTNDIYNTIASFIKDPSLSPDGISIFDKKPNENPSFYWHFPHYSPQGGQPTSAILEYPFKLIYHWGREFVEIFNLNDDPSELVNLSEIENAKADQMKNKLMTWLDTIGAKRPIANPTYNPVLAKVEDKFNSDYGQAIIGKNNGVGWYQSWYPVTSLSSPIVDSTSFFSGVSSGLKFDYLKPSTIRRKVHIPYPLSNNQIYWLAFDLKRSNLNNYFTVSMRGGVPEKDIIKMEYKNSTTSIAVNEQKKAINQSSNNHHILMKIDLSNNEVDSVSVWINHNLEVYPQAVKADLKIAQEINNGFIEQIMLSSGLEIKPGESTWIDNLILTPHYSDLSSNYTKTHFFAYEPFFYSVNGSIQGAGRANEVWAGVWSKSGNLSNNKANISEGSLTYGQIVSLGNKVVFDYTIPNTQIRMDRKLQRPIKNDGNVYWISYLMDTKSTTSLTNISNLNLVNTKITASDGHRIGVGRIYATGKLGLVSPPNSGRFVTNINDIGTHFIIMSISTTGNNSPDTVRVWFDQSGSKQPSSSKADITLQTMLLKEGADVIRLRVEGADNNQVPLTVAFDEIRYSNDWQDLRLSSPTKDWNFDFDFQVYPNPTNEYFLLSNINIRSITGHLKILDLEGKEVLDYGHLNFESNQPIQFSLPHGLAKQAYLISVENDKGKMVKPIIKI